MRISTRGANAPPRVAIVTDEAGWHGAQLRRAFKSVGIDPRYVSLARCRVSLSAAHHGMAIPGYEQALPAGVLVRGIAGGTLEQITLRLDFLHCLADLGVAVYNDARSVEKSVDKGRTSVLLQRAGIPTPPTWVTENPVEARRVLMRETARGGELVIKPLFGSQGHGLRRLKAGMDIPAAADYNGVYYLQRYVERADGQWRDFRVLVIGESAPAAMARHGRSWISNVAQGARCERIAPDPLLQRLALDAARAVGADYAGVDIVRDCNGRFLVLEVNGIPAWRGLQSVTGFNIAARIVEDFLARRLGRSVKEATC